MAKVFKVVTYFTDTNDDYDDTEELRSELNRVHDRMYGCVLPHIAKIEESEEFDWEDDLKLNMINRTTADHEEYFKK